MRPRLSLATVIVACVLLAGGAHAQSLSIPATASRQAPDASVLDVRAAMLTPSSPCAHAAPCAHVAPARVEPDERSFFEPAPEFHAGRFWYGTGGAAVLDAIFTAGLVSVWYDEDERTSFHFYSDSENVSSGGRDDGWLDDWHTFAQQDKFGHVWTAWEITRIAGAYGRWAGLSPGKAGLYGGIVSTVFQAQIEISDGFSSAYGFSRTDALANLVGSTVGAFQVAYPDQLDWFAAKYSYRPSPFYGTRTTGVDGGNPLGYLGNAIKDYDGITYWITVRPEELLQGRAREVWPDWLGLSAGYGADGVAHAISGFSYPDTPEDARVDHRREFYIGPDIDLLHTLDLPQPFRAVAQLFEFVRLPAPALQLAPEVEWHWVFY